jgi:hypothetical protein
VELVIAASGRVACGISRLILQPNFSELSDWMAQGCEEQCSSKDQGGQHSSNVIVVESDIMM